MKGKACSSNVGNRLQCDGLGCVGTVRNREGKGVGVVQEEFATGKTDKAREDIKIRNLEVRKD